MQSFIKINKIFLIALIIYFVVQTKQVAYADINITNCSSNLSSPNTRYVLTANITGNCIVTANNVTIDGTSLYSITGNVVADGNGYNGNDGKPGFNITLQNTTVIGTTSSNGHSSKNDTQTNLGGNGGNITVLNSTIGSVSSFGGYGYGYNSDLGYGGYGGDGGNVTISTSTIGNINVTGSHSYYSGNGGSVTITNSNFGNIDASSGDRNSFGGSISISGTTINISGKSIISNNLDHVPYSGSLTLNFSNIITNNSTTFGYLSDLIVNGSHITPFNAGVFNPTGVSIVSPTSNISTTTWSPYVNWTQSTSTRKYFTNCQYSFGTTTDWNPSTKDWNIGSVEFGTWQGASCTGHGNDILGPPSRGTQIFVIRAYIAGVGTSTDQVSFSYFPPSLLYFYNSGSDSNWSSFSNWYTDINHASTTAYLPTVNDTVTVTGSTTPNVNLDNWVQPSLINSGVTGVQFISQSGASSTLTVNGMATFASSSINHGTVNGNATFNDTSINNGTVNGNAVFNTSSKNISNVVGNATFNGDVASSSTGIISGIKTRYYTNNATTTKNFTGWTVIADGATVNVASTTYDSSTVFRPVNSGIFVGAPTTVYWWSSSNTAWSNTANWYSDFATTTALGRLPLSTESVTLLGSVSPAVDITAGSWVPPIGIDASRTGITFNASSTVHLNENITGTTTLNGSVINDGYIAGNTVLNDSSTNTGAISGNATFNNSSYNNGGVVSGNTIFNNSAYNSSSGKIIGNGTFYNSSYNDGSVFYDGTYYNDSTNSTGITNGTRTRYYNINTSTTRNFVTTGPWTLVADAATVNLSSSIFSTSTTLTTLNGGTFVGGGLPGTTDCSQPLIYPGTYTISSSKISACNIQSQGITLTAGQPFSPTAFYNNASTTGPIDMTGNKLLYHFDTGSATDSSGQSNNGTINGSVTTGVSGEISNAFSFSTNGFISIPDSPSINSYISSNRLTVSVWIKMPNPTGNNFGMIVTKNDDSAWELRMNSNTGKVMFVATVNGLFVDQGTYSTNTVLLPNIWYNVVGKYDGSTVKTYVNGQLDGSYSISGQIGGNASALFIGKRVNGYFFNGAIDELSIWDRALTDNEILNIFNTQYQKLNVYGNGNSFNILNAPFLGQVTSYGATINVTNSTVSYVDVSGANVAGDAQPGGTINFSSSTAQVLLANGGNSTDYGYGGAAGHINLTNGATTTYQSAVAGSNGPNRGANQQNTSGSSSSGGSTVVGCTDPSASNYYSLARVDNGSCRYNSAQVQGCTNRSATNYNPSATINNGTCTYPAPYAPPSNNNGGGNNGNNGNNNNNNNNNVNNNVSAGSSSGGSGSFFSNSSIVLSLPVNQVKKINVKPLPVFGDSKGAFNFEPQIKAFLSQGFPDALKLTFKKAPDLKGYLNAAGIGNLTDIINLNKKPVILPATTTVTGILSIIKSTTTLPISLKTNSTDILYGQTNINLGDTVSIRLIPLNKGNVTISMNDVDYTLEQTKDSKYVSLTISIPKKVGTYTISSPSAAFPIILNVIDPHNSSSVNTPKKSWFKWVISLFGF